MIANCLHYDGIMKTRNVIFDTLFNLSTDLVAFIDIDKSVLNFNNAILKNFCLDSSGIAGISLKSLYERLTHGKPVSRVKIAWKRLEDTIDNVLITLKPCSYIEKIYLDDKQVSYFNILVTPSTNANVLFGVLIIARDITREMLLPIKLENNVIALEREGDCEREFFIKTLLHDLKVPTIAQLRGIQLLQQGMLGNINSSQKEVLDGIVESCTYVLDMISTITCAYRFDNGENSLDCKEFLISDMLKESQYRMLKEYKSSIEIDYDINPDNLAVVADAGVLKTVIVNFILKIMTKYNPQKLVSVKVECLEKFVRFVISIKDTSSNSKSENWIPLKSLLKNLKFITVGYGIELYLCNKIISLHNGNAFVKMKDINIEQFLFEIPRFTE